MIQIVINYDQASQNYRVYEPITDTILVSSNLTEAFVNLSNFLVNKGMINCDLLSYTDISYHLDSFTIKAMIESNVTLLKRLKTAPSGFTQSSQKFGGSTLQSKPSSDNKKSSRRFGRSNFSGKTGFRESMKKFGGI